MYHEAIALSIEAYGEYNYIAGSLYWNLSLVYRYDDRCDMYESYKWLDKCRDTYEAVCITTDRVSLKRIGSSWSILKTAYRL